MVLQALTNIDAGQEITISYIGGDCNDWESRSERQEKLKGGHLFTCKCIRCSLVGLPQYSEMKERRKKLKAMYTELFGEDNTDRIQRSHILDDREIHGYSWAPEGGDYFLLAHEELNDYKDWKVNEQYGIGGHHTVDARLCRAALKAAKQLEDIAERFTDNGEAYDAAVGQTWQANFLAYAIIIGKICYGPTNALGTLDQTATQQLHRCLETTIHTDFWLLAGNVIGIFERTEAGKEFKRRMNATCLAMCKVYDTVLAASKENQVYQEKVEYLPVTDQDGDTMMSDSDYEEAIVLRRICGATSAEAMNEIGNDVVTRYGFVISAPQKERKAPKSGDNSAQKRIASQVAKVRKVVLHPEERSRWGKQSCRSKCNLKMFDVSRVWAEYSAIQG